MVKKSRSNSGCATRFDRPRNDDVTNLTMRDECDKSKSLLLFYLSPGLLVVTDEHGRAIASE